MKYTHFALGFALTALGACARSTPPPQNAHGSYPGRCDLVAVEYAEAPPPEDAPRPDVAERDALFLVARYRPQGGSASPIQLGILVRRADAEALRARLAGQSTVACRPDTGEVEPPALPPHARTVSASEQPASIEAPTAEQADGQEAEPQAEQEPSGQ